jgi:hypothetical protein
MNETQLQLEDKVKQLTHLLNHEIMERQSIAADHHGKCAGLAGVKVYLQILEKKSDKFASTVSELNRVLNAAIDDMRKINRQIHPKEVISVGLISGINEHIKRCGLIYPTEIINYTELKGKLNVPVVQDIGIYRVCETAINFLCLLNYEQLELDFTLKEKTLLFKAEGKGESKQSDKTDELNELKKLAQAQLLWQNAIILPETNWTDTLAFSFALQVLNKE